jgi:AGZA family xanthine/uracil permease-like MFS transporter
MGGRAAYTLACALFIGLGGMLGYLPLLVRVLPLACLAPILVFVGMDIVAQSFQATPRNHAPAVCFAMLPSVAQLLLIILDKANPLFPSAALEPERVAVAAQIPAAFVENFGVFVLLAHGFILTAMIWGAVLAFLIDRRIGAAAAVMGIAAVLALFGFIHSVLPTGGIYLPWRPVLLGSGTPYRWAAAYAMLAVLVFALGRTRAYADSVALDGKVA